MAVSPDHEHRILITDAKALARQRDQQAVVIVGVERDGTVTIVTYGEDKFKCDVIGRWGQGLFKRCISKCPFQTAFGWGNGGKPKRFSAADMLMLGSAGAGYVQQNTHPDAEPS